MDGWVESWMDALLCDQIRWIEIWKEATKMRKPLMNRRVDRDEVEVVGGR